MIRCITTGAAALVLTSLLAACGGGAGGADEARSPAASPEMARSFNEVAAYCGVSSRLPDAGDAGLDTFLSARVERYGMQSAQAAAAPAGWTPFDASDRQSLAVELHDLRSASGRYIGKGGLAYAGIRMGVAFPSLFPAGGIACVAPVSWLKPTADPVDKTLVWESRARAPLPVDTLGATPLDGFELVGNFAVAPGQVFFVALKTMVADAGAVRVCHLPAGAAAWTCAAPEVQDRFDRWSFAVPGAAAGTWMLASTHEGAGQ